MVANVQALIPSYRSKAEERYATYGPILIGDEFGEKVILTMYEPMTFHIPGGRYTPDFLHILESGAMVFVETKKNRKLQSYRDSRAKLRAAAVVFPFFIWVMCVDGELEKI